MGAHTFPFPGAIWSVCNRKPPRKELKLTISIFLKFSLNQGTWFFSQSVYFYLSVRGSIKCHQLERLCRILLIPGPAVCDTLKGGNESEGTATAMSTWLVAKKIRDVHSESEWVNEMKKKKPKPIRESFLFPTLRRDSALVYVCAHALLHTKKKTFQSLGIVTILSHWVFLFGKGHSDTRNTILIL